MINRKFWKMKEGAITGIQMDDVLRNYVDTSDVTDGGYAGNADMPQQVSEMEDFNNISKDQLIDAVKYIESINLNDKINFSQLLKYYLIGLQNINSVLKLSNNEVSFFEKLVDAQSKLKKIGLLKEDLIYWSVDDASPESNKYTLGEDGTSLYTNAQGTVNSNDIAWDLQEMVMDSLGEIIYERIISWMPKSKSVKVKDKCKLGGKKDGTSDACNQGDIDSIDINDINDSNAKRRKDNWVNVAEGVIKRKNDDEIFDYNSVKSDAWNEPIENGQKFYKVNFDLENNESTGEKKTIYVDKNLRKDQPVKYEVNAELWEAGGDWEYPVMYFKIELSRDYNLKNIKNDKVEFPWDLKNDDGYLVSGKKFVIIPPVEAGNKLTNYDGSVSDKYDWTAWQDSNKKGVDEKELKITDADRKNAWNWLIDLIENAIDDRHKMLDESNYHDKKGLFEPYYGKYMIKRTPISEEKVNFGALMLYYDLPTWDNLISKIDENDLYDDGSNTFGREEEPHTTVLYGFHNNVNPNDFIPFLEETGTFFTLKGKNISLFENDDFDVIKIDLEPTDNLLKLRELAETLPNTLTYKDYKPHLTIAYVKSGMGKKYLKDFNGYLKLTSNKVVYSDINKNKYEFTSTEISNSIK